MAAPLSNAGAITPSHRPSRNTVLMRQAEMVAERSTCSRAHVGVVIAHESRVVSQGYNGAPSGMAHCDHTCYCNGEGVPARVVPIDGHLPNCNYACNCAGHPSFQTRANLLSSGPVIHAPGCRKTSPCTIAVHAEANAIAFAAKHGVSTAGAELFTTVAPCLPCAQLIINAGIIRVYINKPYRIHDGLDLLYAAEIPVEMI